MSPLVEINMSPTLRRSQIRLHNHHLFRRALRFTVDRVTPCPIKFKLSVTRIFHFHSHPQHSPQNRGLAKRPSASWTFGPSSACKAPRCASCAPPPVPACGASSHLGGWSALNSAVKWSGHQRLWPGMLSLRPVVTSGKDYWLEWMETKEIIDNLLRRQIYKGVVLFSVSVLYHCHLSIDHSPILALKSIGFKSELLSGGGCWSSFCSLQASKYLRGIICG